MKRGHENSQPVVTEKIPEDGFSDFMTDQESDFETGGNIEVEKGTGLKELTESLNEYESSLKVFSREMREYEVTFENMIKECKTELEKLSQDEEMKKFIELKILELQTYHNLAVSGLEDKLKSARDNGSVVTANREEVVTKVSMLDDDDQKSLKKTEDMSESAEELRGVLTTEFERMKADDKRRIEELAKEFEVELPGAGKGREKVEDSEMEKAKKAFNQAVEVLKKRIDIVKKSKPEDFEYLGTDMHPITIGEIVSHHHDLSSKLSAIDKHVDLQELNKDLNDLNSELAGVVKEKGMAFDGLHSGKSAAEILRMTTVKDPRYSFDKPEETVVKTDAVYEDADTALYRKTLKDTEESLAAARVAYARQDMENHGVVSTLAGKARNLPLINKLFKSSEPDSLEGVKDFYGQAIIEYRKAQVELTDYLSKKRGYNVTDKELGRIFSEVTINEKFRLYEARTTAKTEKILQKTGLGNELQKGASKMVNWYRALPLKKKLYLAGGFFVAGVGASYVGPAAVAMVGALNWGRRGLSGAAGAIGTEALVEQSYQKHHKKEAEQRFEQFMSQAVGTDEEHAGDKLSKMQTFLAGSEAKLSNGLAERRWEEIRKRTLAVSAGATMMLMVPKAFNEWGGQRVVGWAQEKIAWAYDKISPNKLYAATSDPGQVQSAPKATFEQSAKNAVQGRHSSVFGNKTSHVTAGANPVEAKTLPPTPPKPVEELLKSTDKRLRSEILQKAMPDGKTFNLTINKGSLQGSIIHHLMSKGMSFEEAGQKASDAAKIFARELQAPGEGVTADEVPKLKAKGLYNLISKGTEIEIVDNDGKIEITEVRGDKLSWFKDHVHRAAGPAIPPPEPTKIPTPETATAPTETPKAAPGPATVPHAPMFDIGEQPVLHSASIEDAAIKTVVDEKGFGGVAEEMNKNLENKTSSWHSAEKNLEENKSFYPEGNSDTPKLEEKAYKLKSEYFDLREGTKAVEKINELIGGLAESANNQAAAYTHITKMVGAEYAAGKFEIPKSTGTKILETVSKTGGVINTKVPTYAGDGVHMNAEKYWQGIKGKTVVEMNTSEHPGIKKLVKEMAKALDQKTVKPANENETLEQWVKRVVKLASDKRSTIINQIKLKN